MTSPPDGLIPNHQRAVCLGALIPANMSKPGLGNLAVLVRVRPWSNLAGFRIAEDYLPRPDLIEWCHGTIEYADK